MKLLTILIMTITLTGGANIKEYHTTQKKQFVNFINDDGEYARNLVDMTSNEADGFDDLFRGRGASMGGGMGLSENSLAGLPLDGDNIGGPYSQLNSNAFDESNNEQRTGAAPPIGQPTDMFNDPYNSASPSNSFFGSLYTNTPGQGDVLSPFYNSENKNEDSINLGDSMPINNPADVNSFNNVLQSLNHENDYPTLMKNPGKGKSSTSSDELGEIDTSEEKLQKLLETNIGEDSNSASATVGSFLSALLSQQGNNFHTQHIGQQQPMSLQDGSNYGVNQQQMQQNSLNQLSGSLSPNDMPVQSPVTVHVHASDKPVSHKETSMNLPDESRAVAQQAQNNAMRQHKLKLSKLKKRLALLREKLTELEDEQSKKSTQKSNDPQETRKDAIKRILIKNLRIAAMIASKEVQLEESKSHDLESMSRKTEDVGSHVVSTFSSKPVTELSRKAEDEVNHLTSDRTTLNSTLRQKSKLVQTMHNSSQFEQNVNTTTVVGGGVPNETNKTLQLVPSYNNLTRKSFLVKDYDTPQTLGRGEIFLKKLRTQINSMSLDKAG